MHCTLVSHTHWDREWYRTFQGFRARLVDAIDRILDLVAEDPEFRFLLDGQTIVLEDYLEIRPHRRPELERACRERRITIGPWYVQPDSLLPAGETHIRNLLEGRRVGLPFGGVSSVAYTPDSFGHPAQFPQIFRGFGLGPFVYWRGNGSEIDDLPAEYRWESPDGTSVLAHHLGEGYFGACGLPDDPLAAAVFLEELAESLLKRTRNSRVLLMNGIDHAIPGPGVGAALDVVRRTTGWTVKRGVLEDFVEGLSEDAPVYRGELVGGRLANLLPGVWSARMPLKLRNRAAESALLVWAEPWAGLALVHGLADERPSLRLAWRSLLCNQAHDSICGCSQDLVHDQGEARYDTASELAEQTTRRCLERLAGLDEVRTQPWDADLDVAVFNPTEHARTDVLRFPLEAINWVEFRGQVERTMQVHPLLGGTTQTTGYTVDGVPARLVREPDSPRLRLETDKGPLCVETIVRDVPPFGWRRVRLQRSEAHPDVEDDGHEIVQDGLSVAAAPDGTLDVTFGDRIFRGLCGLEDIGDRGDTYDFDPVASPAEPRLESVRVTRRRHPGGIQVLAIERTFSTPLALGEDRRRRSVRRVESSVTVEARIADGVPRVDLDVVVRNEARDHRLRFLFPTGSDGDDARAATTSDIVSRRPGDVDATGWVHEAPRTFCQQGFVSAGGLTVGAPGLPEAEVTDSGTIAITVVRSVGWLALMDLESRPVPAGPVVRTPKAQCTTPFSFRMTLSGDSDPRVTRAFEAGFEGVVAGGAPLVPDGVSLLALECDDGSVLLVETVKPAEEGTGIVLRLLNPTDEEGTGRVRIGFPAESVTPIRLDEDPVGPTEPLEGGGFGVRVPPHAMQSFLLD